MYMQAKQQEVEVTVLSNLLIAFFTMCSHIIPLQKDVRRVEFIGVESRVSQATSLAASAA